jgi:PAS domain S-box-containing protein
MFDKVAAMTRASSTPSFADYRTVGEAAQFLGVSTATLRNWDRSGKLKPRRHPQNGYRIYLHSDLEAVLRLVDSGPLVDESAAPLIDWNDIAESEHFVQFYESDEFLVESVTGFVAAALNDGQGSVVIATAEHHLALEQKLADLGVDLMAALSAGRWVPLDAADTLAKFMVNGSPDPQRFAATVGATIAQLARGGGRVHAFGEMVALLWSAGQRDAAIKLEELWNELGQRHRFALFCAYPIAAFAGAGHEGPFNGVCSCHTRVIPSESYSEIQDPADRLRAISRLQQKANSLAAEIVHRTQVEGSLARRERELNDFFENATEGIHKVGPDGTILWANRADYGLLGYSREEFIGRSIKEFHADADVIEEFLQRLLRGETLENASARLLCKDGSIKHVLINSNSCFEDGQFQYTRCFTRDVTRQWEAEQALRDADRRKDEFLATLAHELRNPLAPIRNALEMLRANEADQRLVAEARDLMDRQVVQVTRLVDDLLDLSRITRDKIELRRERIELADVIKAAIETSQPLIEQAGHALAVDLPAAPMPIDADAARLAQVFSNLLNNSAKYTEPGGRIALSVQPQRNEVVIRVRDNGIGISREALAYVFDMFRQADHIADRAEGGLGIGLTLVRRLVEMHGGAVTAHSDGPGQGSEFSVRLPLARAAERGPEAKSRLKGSGAKHPAGPKRRILVVDDNCDAGNSLARLLRMKGHDVHVARDGLEAIAAATADRPEIILMDVGMPKLNGYDATRRIRQLPGGQEIFIIALTGWGQEHDMNRSAEAGCSAHLVKPVDFAELDGLLASAPRSVNSTT